jgi:excisionase family DNA binding protein
VTASRQAAPRPLRDCLALGEASRFLGVDPDTLRRWSDEGRVPAFTTPGGHRRFERRVLERLIASRRTGPADGLAGLGATQDRLSAAYRRRYVESHGPGPDPRETVPPEDRDSFRDLGRRLVDALVRHVGETGNARATAARDAVDLAADLGDRMARHGVPMPEAIAMFLSARRPFLTELTVLARRRGIDAARFGPLCDTTTSLLDRLLLAFVQAHAAATAATREVAANAPAAAPGIAPRRSA